MATVFREIVDGGYFIPFGSLSAPQRQCKDYTNEVIDDLFATRQRERYIHEVKACITGYPPADEDEPMVVENFSQYQFYRPFDEDLVAFVDKFDYLVCCVAFGVCKVHKGFEDRYQRALLTVLTFRSTLVPARPVRVLDPLLMVAPGPVYSEQGRSAEQQAGEVVRYLAKQDPFTAAVREELARLQDEEERAVSSRSGAPHAASRRLDLDESAAVDAGAGGGEAAEGQEEPEEEDVPDPTPMLSLVLYMKVLYAQEETEKLAKEDSAAAAAAAPLAQPIAA